MKQIKIIIFSLFILGCNSSNESKEMGVVKDDTFAQFTALINQYAENTMAKGNINSLALAVYRDGNIYENYYGELDKDANNKPDDSTLYEIASITKVFTGSLASKAVLEGKISLDDDIRKYLKGDYSNLEFEGQPITIQHLLTHTLGLKEKTPKGLQEALDKIDSESYNDNSEEYNIQNLLEELKTVEVNNTPGTVHAYSFVGPELMAYILEQVNGKSFKEQLDVFFKELGMNNTYLQDYDKHKKYLANSYEDRNKAEIFFNPLIGGSGGAISTLPDLTKFMQFQLESKQPWVKESSRILFEDNEDNTIGYFWEDIGIGEEEGYYYSKTGTSNGVQSGILICPDSNYGIVMIMNTVSEDAMNDWLTLFFTDIEPDLIRYPKLNLISKLKNDFVSDTKQAFIKYRMLKRDTTTYFSDAQGLNSFGYQLFYENQEQKAIEIFTFATEEFPENANLFDSLGEVYFNNEDYENALDNYKKSLELNPDNENAQAYIEKIKQLSL